MKRVRFRDQAGSVRTGEWVDEDGDPADDETAGVDGHIEYGGETYDPDAVDLLPPCEPTKVVCVGRNYADHADEQDVELPDRPLYFLKGPNAVADPGGEVPLPAGKDLVEYEGEMGVVIGQQCRNVPQEDAMDVIAGFTCVNDISNRDDQNREVQWVRGKAFDNAAPIGPVLATPEHVPENASIRTWLNGELRQSSDRETLIFSIPELIAEVTDYVTLEPGDVLATGTPEGVGALSDGDEVAIRMEGVGTLVHTVSE